MKFLWAILCEKSIVNSESNNISLLEVIETIGITISPQEEDKYRNENKVMIPANFELVCLWSKEKKIGSERADMKVELISSKNKSLLNFEKNFEIPTDKRRARTKLTIQGITFNESGMYQIIISLKNSGTPEYKKVGEVPLEVVINFGN